MFNIIITILAIPFLPVFMYGDLVNDMNQDSEIHAEVLGEASEKENDENYFRSGEIEDLQNYSLFPLEKNISFGLAPVRKSGYTDIKIWAGSSVVIDFDSGTILEYYNGRKQTQIASLTKVMTAILVVENAKNLNETAIITREALNVPGTTVGCPTSVFCDSKRMYVGEEIIVKDLLKAMLLSSANDAAEALAIHIAGTSDKFVEMMNKKAKTLGLKDTNFCTASGLEIDGKEAECYSSAYDIARITAYSLRYELIWDIMRIEEAQIYSADGKYMHQLKNTDILLSEMPYCIGGKTGFTPMAGKSLLSAATDSTGKHKIIAVILNDENRWEDMKKLVDWVFDNYEWK